MSDESMTGTFRLNLPKELLAAAARDGNDTPQHLEVEGWRNSWWSRISELFVGKD